MQNINFVGELFCLLEANLKIVKTNKLIKIILIKYLILLKSVYQSNFHPIKFLLNSGSISKNS